MHDRPHTIGLLVPLLLCLAVPACGTRSSQRTATTATTARTIGPTGVGGAAPPIMVEVPRRGDTARSPLAVSGTADVFEAVLFVELRDGRRVVTSRRVMASAGTGARGRFAATLAFDAAHVTKPTLVAFSRSPRDGSRENEVRIPLRAAGT